MSEIAVNTPIQSSLSEVSIQRQKFADYIVKCDEDGVPLSQNMLKYLDKIISAKFRAEVNRVLQDETYATDSEGTTAKVTLYSADGSEERTFRRALEQFGYITVARISVNDEVPTLLPPLE